MSLELLIAANTAALEANTAALQQVLSAAAVTPVAAAAPAPKAAKTKKETPAPVEEAAPAPVEEATPAPVVKETPAPVVKETPAPVVEETPAPAPVVEEAAPFDREAAIQKITLLVRAAFTASGAGLQAKKDEYEVIRKNFAVATAKDLRDDQFADFITAVEKL